MTVCPSPQGRRDKAQRRQRTFELTRCLFSDLTARSPSPSMLLCFLSFDTKQKSPEDRRGLPGSDFFQMTVPDEIRIQEFQASLDRSTMS